MTVEPTLSRTGGLFEYRCDITFGRGKTQTAARRSWEQRRAKKLAELEALNGQRARVALTRTPPPFKPMTTSGMHGAAGLAMRAAAARAQAVQPTLKPLTSRVRWSAQ